MVDPWVRLSGDREGRLRITWPLIPQQSLGRGFSLLPQLRGTGDK